MGGPTVNLTIPAGLSIRPGAGDLDFTDLAPGCERVGSASWDGAQTLSLPFDPEPSAQQQQLIRRRLLTRDAEEERVVAGLVAEHDAAEGAVRLLIEDRVGRIEGW